MMTRLGRLARCAAAVVCGSVLAAETSPEKSNEKKESKVTPNPVVIMETSEGTLEVELLRDKAPITVANFLTYVDDEFFDGTIFHRVIKNFMIQGGGFTPDMQQKTTGEPIKNEADNGLKNMRGTLAMARTREVNSATSQFFVNVVDNDFLNHGNRDFGYAVFARVVEGMEVVDKIAACKTGSKGMHRDVPVEPVVIKSIRRKQDRQKD